MRIEENRLIIAEETTDEMLDELLENIKKDEVEVIQIDTDNISSLCLQQIFCIANKKKVEVNNTFIEKFFVNINHI